MARCYLIISSLLLLLVALSISPSHSINIKSASFLSPKQVMTPGSVADPYLFDIDFPRGHIGLKGFDAEVVDQDGNPVPLHETYLHHWVVHPYYVRKGLNLSHLDTPRNLGSSPDYILVSNGGLCRNRVRQYFGLGSETRKTSTYVPDPYAIEIGNPEKVPDGYEFKWLLNIHAIDTRGVVDKQGCTECRSVLLPAKVYILDVTDSWERSEGSTGDNQEHFCHVEYDVKPCKTKGDGCVDVKKKSLMMPFNGYIVYGDGEVICSSMPKYGNGDEPGSEAGYIVGMSSCYPEPVKVTNGETLSLEFNYSNVIGHTGVMGLFYILVSQQLPGPKLPAHSSSMSFLAFLAVTVAVVVLIVAVVYRRKNREDGYQSLST
ncbi:hypothetical protein HID58_049768 [Brassica napus]|uniref:Uncharacterized protein n=1 Tax=Brassica napus TaxID=3708 RepID=A0ABQ8B5Z2_BRANA|nr:hypothetical protein HID58_049768 [Brassica napus]